jgi:hypothetical protein
MTDELTALVVAEKRGLDAVSGLTVIMGGAGVFAALRVLPSAGYALFATVVGVVGWCLRKRRALGKLLARRNEIGRVERTTELGRPALRVYFLGGGSVTLKTWNHDPDRVFTLLSKRELPPARLLK